MVRSLLSVLLLCCATTSAFVFNAHPATPRSRATAASMQLAMPDAPTKVPDLPTTWEVRRACLGARGFPARLERHDVRSQVPDTLPARFSGTPPLFRVTLFDDGKIATVRPRAASAPARPPAPAPRAVLSACSHGTQAFIEKTLVDVVPDMSEDEAIEIAYKVTNMGFAQVGVWAQDLAESIGEQLKDRKLFVDVSPE